MNFFKRILNELVGNPSSTPAAPAPAPVFSHQPPPPAPSARPWWADQLLDSSVPLITVFAPDGAPQFLGPVLGRGGEANVHLVPAVDRAVIKLYHSQVLANPRRVERLRAKLAALFACSDLKNDPQLAWPLFEVFDAERQWTGFAMNRVAGKPLITLFAPAAMRKELPHWDLRHLVATAGNLARRLDRLARAGVLVGDISPLNFLVDPASAKVAFIDCDSYQVRRGAELLPCPVVTPSHAAPELLADGRSDAPRTEEMLRFSAAILFFQILTSGVHPFQHKGSIDPAEDIRKGACPLYAGSGAFMHPEVWKRYDALPWALKNLFVRTFREGHGDPSARPALSDWVEAFARYLKQLQAAA